MTDADIESIDIIAYPHPTLRIEAKPIVRVDSDLKKIAERMLDLMYESKGVGLAATQVNIPIRMFVLNESGDRDEGEEMVLINPELQRPKGSETSQEGCLSLPGIHGDVKRPKEIRLTAYTINGELVEKSFSGFIARVLQHENDHLDGKMFFERMSPAARDELLEKLDDLESDFRHRQRAGEIADDAELISQLQPWYERYT